ncbi:MULTISPECIES: cupin domain-containing protein [Aeromonas]|jgi:cupin 2 domain-containing protein|uniref:Cupin domain-containing protein n=1 Tax=Aeromonas taiwanensis TaxID=633417 RepID=A0A5F0K695_9GAMM|nr:MULTISPECIES: cupin domain-containing protein [Aeromonas]MBP4042184.1 cupin domain-containing protein [Aeromonas sp. SrichE-2G]MCO4204978.1 cupin domain-containing protein [Aeromonas taiwanensis]TFF71990.1 cupin domain-containing protein [Aeromonas taiwanensis]TFF72546.1 cupin domain-containing protein [Aeromonas taiwanensis]TFF75181.1 cupin domain-containing protein [Aeromonas taiwanensis]
MHTGNLFGKIPSPLPNEVFTDLVSTNHFRIERILSLGHQTPSGEWFDQDEHEWVLLVQGEAILVFITPDTGEQERAHLGPGDYINIPAHLQHRVEWTHPTEATVWLCIYY